MSLITAWESEDVKGKLIYSKLLRSSLIIYLTYHYSFHHNNPTQQQISESINDKRKCGE